MKIRSGYILRKVMDIYTVLGIGSEAYEPGRIMSVNETGAFLWRLLESGAEKEELAERLTKEYDVDAGTAAKDVDAFLAKLRETGLIEE